MRYSSKESSTATKTRAVFDASMKTMSGVSLNDLLKVGPTVHPSLVDVLLRFRMHRIAIVADISKMYRAIELPPSDRVESQPKGCTPRLSNDSSHIRRLIILVHCQYVGEAKCS